MRFFFLIILVNSFLSSCTSGSHEELFFNDVIESASKSSISGYVNLYDEGTFPMEDKSGMQIKIEELSSFSATTDKNGYFTLKDVPFGTYTLIYEKTGYGTYKKYQHKHYTSSTFITHSPSLGKKSTTQINNITAKVEGDSIALSFTTNYIGAENNKFYYIRYFLSSSPSVSDSFYSYYSPTLMIQKHNNALILTKSDLLNRGFHSGEKLYIKIYGDSYFSNVYDDPFLGKKIFPNLNRISFADSNFIVP